MFGAPQANQEEALVDTELPVDPHLGVPSQSSGSTGEGGGMTVDGVVPGASGGDTGTAPGGTGSSGGAGGPSTVDTGGSSTPDLGATAPPYSAGSAEAPGHPASDPADAPSSDSDGIGVDAVDAGEPFLRAAPASGSPEPIDTQATSDLAFESRSMPPAAGAAPPSEQPTPGSSPEAASPHTPEQGAVLPPTGSAAGDNAPEVFVDENQNTIIVIDPDDTVPPELQEFLKSVQAKNGGSGIPVVDHGEPLEPRTAMPDSRSDVPGTGVGSGIEPSADGISGGISSSGAGSSGAGSSGAGSSGAGSSGAGSSGAGTTSPGASENIGTSSTADTGDADGANTIRIKAKDGVELEMDSSLENNVEIETEGSAKVRINNDEDGDGETRRRGNGDQDQEKPQANKEKSCEDKEKTVLVPEAVLAEREAWEKARQEILACSRIASECEWYGAESGIYFMIQNPNNELARLFQNLCETGGQAFDGVSDSLSQTVADFQAQDEDSASELHGVSTDTGYRYP